MNSEEITLNSVKYGIVGEVHISGDSRFAQKMVTGDFTKDSDKRRSSHTSAIQRRMIKNTANALLKESIMWF